ncbi:MAG: trehalose-phosphatase [Methylocystis sp.]|uniref:trehalose-phosphatase n=1 Tax=Methylocystis sp. TaxID=1911079 RepID=UPI003D0F1E15
MRAAGPLANNRQEAVQVSRKLLEGNKNIALFLDFDGTLVDISAAPDAIDVPAGLPELLALVSERLEGRLAILTGRPIASIDRFLSPFRCIAAGAHGAELRLDPSQSVVLDAPPIASSIIDAAQQAIRPYESVTLEVKRTSIAVHYRLCPEVESPLRRALQDIVADRPEDLVVLGGRKVFEIIPRGASKGGALERILSLPKFEDCCPVAIGDDLTDVTAIEAANRLGGVGLSVGGEYFPADSANFSGPSDLRNWLEKLAKGETS